MLKEDRPEVDHWQQQELTQVLVQELKALKNPRPEGLTGKQAQEVSIWKDKEGVMVLRESQ